MRAICCVLALATIAGCTGKGDGGPGVRPYSSSAVQACEFKAASDTTSCVIDVKITRVSNKPHLCRVKPQMVYVATGNDSDLSKFGGTVSFKVDAPEGDLEFHFKDTGSGPWKPEKPQAGTSYALSIDPKQEEGVYAFKIKITKNGTLVCETNDPVIGNGVD